MPITPATITFNISSLPSALQTFITDLDTALANGWTLGERTRQLTFQWSTYGGYTAPKLSALQTVLALYADRGWTQAAIAKSATLSNQTQVTLIFSW